jgi:hypothetical protein
MSVEFLNKPRATGLWQEIFVFMQLTWIFAWCHVFAAALIQFWLLQGRRWLWCISVRSTVIKMLPMVLYWPAHYRMDVEWRMLWHLELVGLACVEKMNYGLNPTLTRTPCGITYDMDNESNKMSGLLIEILRAVWNFSLKLWFNLKLSLILCWICWEQFNCVRALNCLTCDGQYR